MRRSLTGVLGIPSRARPQSALVYDVGGTPKPSSGESKAGAEWELWFAPKHYFSAKVSWLVINAEFKLTKADPD